MNKKVSISLQPLGKTIEVIKDTPLIDVLHEFGVEFPCGGKGTCGACKIKILKGDLAIDRVEKERLQKLKLGPEWRLACFCSANTNLTLEITQFENIILADNSAFEFSPEEGYGIAVDLGTTTLVAQLVDLSNGHIIDSVSDVNPQVKYGGDLIARIQACLDGKQQEMQKLIRVKIAKMIAQLEKNHPVEFAKIELVGNTAMHHIFCGLDVQPLSFYPFESPVLGVQTFTAEDLDWQLPGSPEIRFHASIGSFVGSDILAGIAATKMAEKEAYSLLIDLGTNGEIVLGNKKQIICASTAAGPAFEGAKINQGMRATTGAVSSLKFKDGKIEAHVIGNVEAKGICGSGLIDAMAILLEEQKIGLFGEINSGEEAIELTPGVQLQQSDIREFQLAKAAIAAGVQILLNTLNISKSDVEKVFIAGGFGNFLNLKNVIRTGLLECEEAKITKLGNTALIGAKMFLFQDENYTQEILSKTSHINLEGDGTFQDIYIEKMMLL
ncbi:ASKHA domain-containing protein [uncultured Draconibacterium sp.]|uniref:ASKHA domain-containing protein n=1 Tax=uncultured Draconibacterium sp. TaxID=1573823 RepID=UPI0025E7EADE|nr:ASKHA domain-containing protein [uncultured Draconibacterium sp.]